MNLLILGAGGHGRVIKEIAEATKECNRVAFLDDSYDGFNPDIIGRLFDYGKEIGNFSHAFVAIGDPAIRKQWQKKLLVSGFEIPILIHPDAYVSPSSIIEIGTVIMPKAVVQSNAKIGVGCIISAGAIIDHDTVIGDYCHINAGAVIASGSRIPEGTKVDYAEVFRNSEKVPVANRDLFEKYKSDFRSEISFF